MTITNLSEITDEALIAAANPVPFTIVVDSQQSTTVTISIAYEGGDTIASGMEMLNYKTEGTFRYFTCDLRTLLQSTFDTFDDELQGAFSWKNMSNMLNDITLTAVATNTASETATLEIDFTIANVAKQFAESIVLCENPADIYNTCEMETIYTGKDNIGYIYVLTNTTDRIGLTEDSALFFCDYDDIYFCDYNDNLFFEK